jgi:hypothetical protein
MYSEKFALERSVEKETDFDVVFWRAPVFATTRPPSPGLQLWMQARGLTDVFKQIYIVSTLARYVNQ